MNVEDVRQRIEAIRKIAVDGDDESAHSEEDKLYLDLLTAIAGGTCSAPAECATEAIKTKTIQFARWCA